MYPNELVEKCREELNINSNALEDRLRSILDKFKEGKILIYGAGSHTIELFKLFDFSNYKIIGVCDSDANKHGKSLLGHEIFSPSQINEVKPDLVLISSFLFQEELFSYLRAIEINPSIEIKKIYKKNDREFLKKDHEGEIYRLQRTILSKNRDEDIRKLCKYYIALGDFLNAKRYIKKLAKHDEFKPLYKTDERKKGGTTKHDKPNICLIIVDAARADHLGHDGYKRNTSPFLDSLASNGIVFENAFSTSTWTLPSTASILTGRLPFEHGACFHHSKLNSNMNNIVSQLRERGYYTAASVSISFLDPFFGFENLFDDYMYTPGEYYAPNVIRKGLDLIKSKEPFFLVLNLMDAHYPYKCLNHRWGDPTHEFEFTDLYESKIGSSQIKKLIDGYDDGIRYIDDQIKEYFNHFPENTVFIIMSDHGELFGESGYMRHDTTPLIDEVLRVPLIIHGPGEIVKKHVIKKPFSLKNIPMIIKQLSTGNYIRDETFDAFEEFIIAQRGKFNLNQRDDLKYSQLYSEELKYNVQCIRDNKYKLVEYSSGKYKFYELPDENRNIINSDEHKVEIQRMKILLSTHGNNLDKINVNWLENNDLSKNKEVIERLKKLGYV